MIPKKLSLFMVCLLFLGCIGQPPEPAEEVEKELLHTKEEAYYAHIMLDRPVGYTHYAVKDPIQYENDNVHVVEAETFLNFEMGGTPLTMDYTSTEYYTNQLNPKYYTVTVKRGEEKTEIECIFKEGKVQEKIDSPDKSEEKEISITDNTYLLDSNVFHHYVFLFRTLEPEIGTEKPVSLFMPQAMQTITTNISFKKEETFQGTPVVYAEAEIMGQNHKFWVTPEGELLALEIPSQKFRMEVSDSDIVEQVESVEVIQLLSTLSNVSFDTPPLVTYMKIDITATIAAEPVNKDFLSSKYQTFSGEVTESEIDGIFEISTEKYTGPGDDYPVGEPKEYLGPEEKLESDDPAIKAQAQEITTGSADSWEASKQIAQWVYENIRYTVTGAGAKETLETKKGDCGPHSYLTVALLRSIGIPSRIVGGVVYGRIGGEPRFIQHYWTEVLIQGEWIPFDSTMGQYGYVDATHVRLFKLGGIQEMDVEVLDYTQEKPEIEIEEKEALLQVGEYYKYRFVLNDVEFGYTDYKIKRRETYEGEKAFYVELSLDLDYNKIGNPVVLDLDAVLYITEDIRPLYYDVDALVNDEKQTIECTFTEDKVLDTVTVGSKTYEEEVTLEEGTYLMQSNVIGLWALVYRTLELETGKTYKVPVFFSENFSKYVVEINVLRTETITVAGKTYDVFVCDVPFFKEVDYVTQDGLLVKVDLPSQNVFIELMESSSCFII
ncbi:MAG: transglutaminase domain-containing protein [Candidatus Methanofastidiosia archaeon]|jgi:transglutaminase-like putative cysteine protease